MKKLSKPFWFAALAATLLIASAGLAVAGGVHLPDSRIDQEVDSPNSGTTAVSGGFDRGQTFVSSVCGILVKMEFHAKNMARGSNAGNVVVELRRQVNGMPSDDPDDVLKTATFTNDQIDENGWVHWDQINLGVRRGQGLAFVIRTPTSKAGTRPYDWTVAEPNVYKSGKAFCRSSNGDEICGSSWTAIDNQDNWFRSWVIPVSGALMAHKKGGEGEEEYDEETYKMFAHCGGERGDGEQGEGNAE